MKMIFRISLLLFAAAAMLSCNKVSEPYYVVKAVYGDTTKRAVLLEDYTGHKCFNCAPAATVAATIRESYEGQVFVISVHAGNFATPNPADPNLTADFRCAAGNDWFGSPDFKISGNPMGMVNRKPYNGSISFGTTEWNPAVQKAVVMDKQAIMTVHNTFNNQNRMLNTRVDVKFLKAWSGEVSLTVCVIEDSIYGGQLNVIPPDSIPIIKKFRFMHVLRGSLNGSWGEKIAENPPADALITRSYSLDMSGNTWDPAHCSAIAFISDANTKEVLHVAGSEEFRP